MSPTKAPARAHSAPTTARRKSTPTHHRKALGALVLAGLCALGVGVWFLLHSAALSAQHVKITGAVHTSEQEVLAVTKLATRPPLIDVNAASDVAALDELPWVLDARVQRVWPDSVRVSIVERVPIGEVALPGATYALIDAHGRVLADAPMLPAGVVALRDVTPVQVGSYLGARAQGVLAIVDALPVSLVPRVSYIGTSAGDGIVMQLRGGPLVVVHDASDARQKMISLATVLARTSVAGIVTIDLSVPSSPVLTR